ncbi:sigma-70 family RNA polymerase sigma factor [Microbispora sp. SCL1-1]|uniref:Sigma-70 family RNA polymerase sigma factor n=1 Tax=Microbispora hainanensis TaxID=568844 RepID=A0ABZ1SMN0_9ACTN|nr:MULTISPECIES: sigma-70 family RNA polymerase sigma factor [Microbispora]NJP27786.1 sigma-70 family RNA polymerase sigma factor [Microbispora sp. CL1-1]TQS10558.1 sigma-70 family RNA polymerase sigma factor [Microbispora sp. SCL1-1]
MAADHGLGQHQATLASADAESAEWLRTLGGAGAEREAAVERLHAILLRVAGNEVRRRAPRLRLSGPELDDMAHQAAADALLAVIAKLGQFRGESRFTTWAYKFAVLEVSAKLGRHFWRDPGVPLEGEDWERLPDRFEFDPAERSERRALVDALRRAVDEELTERQRHIFVTIVLQGVPSDAVAVELGTNRNAIYKAMFDVRRKLRAALVAQGFLDIGTARRS